MGVVIFALIALAIVVVGIMLAWVGAPPERLGEGRPPTAPAETDAPPPFAAELPPASAVEAASLFAPVYEVLVSPRCMNCHPDGDRPLSERSGVHPMNISRRSAESGLPCGTCHADRNTELPGSPLGPPGAPHWQLPPAETPMIFEHRTITELCLQLRDPAANGERSLAELLEHVTADPLVLWGWSPGGERAKPPLSHPLFVERFSAWVDAGGICPGEQVAPTQAEAEDAAPESPGA